MVGPWSFIISHSLLFPGPRFPQNIPTQHSLRFSGHEHDPHVPPQVLSDAFCNIAMEWHHSAASIALISLPFLVPEGTTKHVPSAWSSFIFSAVTPVSCLDQVNVALQKPRSAKDGRTCVSDFFPQQIHRTRSSILFGCSNWFKGKPGGSLTQALTMTEVPSCIFSNRHASGVACCSQAFGISQSFSPSAVLTFCTRSSLLCGTVCIFTYAAASLANVRDPLDANSTPSPSSWQQKYLLKLPNIPWRWGEVKLLPVEEYWNRHSD